MTNERYRIANELWKSGFNAEILYNENPRMDKQMDHSIENKIPFVIFIGENELKESKIKVKCMANGKEHVFSRDTYISDLLALKQDQNLYFV